MKKDYHGYIIRFKNGKTGIQMDELQSHTCDWNNDNDIYPEYGAYFKDIDSEERYGFYSEADLKYYVNEYDPNNNEDYSGIEKVEYVF